MLAASSLASLTAAPTVRRLICCCWALPLAILRVTPGGRQLDVCVELLGSPWHPWTAGGAPRARARHSLRAVVARRSEVGNRESIRLRTLDFALRAVWLPSPQPCPSLECVAVLFPRVGHPASVRCTHRDQRRSPSAQGASRRGSAPRASSRCRFRPPPERPAPPQPSEEPPRGARLPSAEYKYAHPRVSSPSL